VLARTWVRRYWWTGPVAVLALAVIWAILWPLTDALAAHDVAGYAAAGRVGHLQSAREAVRTQLLTLGAGVFAAGALIFTARNFSLSREAQVTDRYTKAIDQLGSDKLDVRIGGIYALERVAHDSVRDHPTVMEVLCAFIREHSREPRSVRDKEQDDTGLSIRPDVQAALTVIGRRDSAKDVRELDLLQANLGGANLYKAELGYAQLRDADLQHAFLVGAKLNMAHLSGADLHEAKLGGRADLSNADLSGANLSGADLDGANLHKARLNAAVLRDANLRGSFLGGARLQGADLAGANLDGVNLSVADLRRADLRGADLTGTVFRDADLTGADLTGTVLGGAKFWFTSLKHAKLTDADLTRADFVSVSFDRAFLDGANLSELDLRSVSFGAAILAGANLSGADLNGLDLTKVDLTDEQNPRGVTGAIFVRANLTGTSWPEDEPAPSGWVRDPETGKLANETVSHDADGSSP
jgi:uncharacterized protein YjbI with pentapeptide repeats